MESVSSSELQTPKVNLYIWYVIPYMQGPVKYLLHTQGQLIAIENLRMKLLSEKFFCLVILWLKQLYAHHHPPLSNVHDLDLVSWSRESSRLLDRQEFDKNWRLHSLIPLPSTPVCDTICTQWRVMYEKGSFQVYECNQLGMAKLHYTLNSKFIFESEKLSSENK